MDFRIIEESFIEDGSKCFQLKIATKDQIYLAFIMESFEDSTPGGAMATLNFKLLKKMELI